ncbi:hypothetical protein GL50803_0011113 [Giardia duodenalis]|uniref:Uncharacterized protein n=2 Tax=Giardia intestinalis TaxID=5741 RepID=D3KGD3_GIAIC|nr:hypothetical protein GL50803_0011113 [Giardia intestinalis]ESU39714.1 Hypothetical protein DHA2_151297 [Giardia intestinalis]KAE8305076.1 hypothetical protein GL50803_0011113 [Giardia intestinalis]
MNGENAGQKTTSIGSTRLSKAPYGDIQQAMDGIVGTVSFLKGCLERLLQEIEQINYDMQLTTAICTRYAIDPKTALSCLQQKAYTREQALLKIAAHLRLYSFFQSETRQLLADISANKELAAVLPHQYDLEGPAVNPK